MEKPNAETILSYYSTDELLELAKQKARLLLNEKMEELKAYLLSFSCSVIKHDFQENKQEAPQAVRRSIVVKGNKEKGEKKSLKKRVLEVIGKQPMSIDEIMNALIAGGYESKAQDARRVLYHELGRLIDSGALRKAGRGLYRKG